MDKRLVWSVKKTVKVSSIYSLNHLVITINFESARIDQVMRRALFYATYYIPQTNLSINF
jgi:hypothetical protein